MEKLALYTYTVAECGDGCCSWNESTIEFFIDGKEQYGLGIEGSMYFSNEADFQKWLDDYGEYEDVKWKPHPNSSYC